MKSAWLIAALCVITSVSVHAQDLRSEEAAIRALIAGMNDGKAAPATADRVFWSGALKRPIIGKEQGEALGGPEGIANRVPGSQKTRITPVRIEIAKSADMAWEFSNSHTSFQLKDGKTVEFDQSLLRVWKRDASGWKIAAFFVHPHEE